MKHLVFFGAPGAGKGTQAKKLAEQFNLSHISTGDVLRNEIAGLTELGNLAKKYMDKGELVPDDVIIAMVEHIIEKLSDQQGFILDGFPRTIPQVEALDIMLDKHNRQITKVIFLDVPKQELVNRLSSRAEIEGRADDKDINIIENRINVYNQKTTPVLDFYSKQNKLVHINGIGTIDDIYNRILSVV